MDVIKSIDLRKRAEARNREVYLDGVLEEYKYKLMTLFKTCFIGNIDILEKTFGHLWGHGKHVSELTRSEEDWREQWAEVRKAILDNGNKQLRAAQDEINKYSLEPIKDNKIPLRKAGQR